MRTRDPEILHRLRGLAQLNAGKIAERRERIESLRRDLWARIDRLRAGISGGGRGCAVSPPAGRARIGGRNAARR